MSFEDLKNPEIQEKLKDAKSLDEFIALAKEEGFELTDEELDKIAGGWPNIQCPLPPMPEGVIV